MADRTSASRIGSTVLFFVAAALVAGLLSRPGSSPLEGKSAADFSLASVSDATRFHLAEQRGTPVLIEVFASWCSVCRHAAPAMAEAAAAKRSGAVRFVGVSVDDTPEIAQRTKGAWGMPYDVVLDDGRFTRAYGVKLLPTYILVGADGEVKKATSGALSGSELESWLSGVGATRM
jgi:thiol-disulfide isomerase/thioredoxin